MSRVKQATLESEGTVSVVKPDNPPTRLSVEEATARLVEAADTLCGHSPGTSDNKERPMKPEPTTHEEHWANKDPEGQPPWSAVAGLGRLVTESRLRLGEEATPERVTEELRGAGVGVSEEEVRKAWDRGA